MKTNMKNNSDTCNNVDAQHLTFVDVASLSNAALSIPASKSPRWTDWSLNP